MFFNGGARVFASPVSVVDDAAGENPALFFSRLKRKLVSEIF
jgi:hypothetical protein